MYWKYLNDFNDRMEKEGKKIPEVVPYAAESRLLAADEVRAPA